MVRYHTKILLFPINSKGYFTCNIPQAGLHIPRPLLLQSWIHPTTIRTMSGRSFHGATSRSIDDADLFDARKLHHLSSFKECQIVVFFQMITSAEICLKYILEHRQGVPRSLSLLQRWLKKTYHGNCMTVHQDQRTCSSCPILARDHGIGTFTTDLLLVNVIRNNFERNSMCLGRIVLHLVNVIRNNFERNSMCWGRIAI